MSELVAIHCAACGGTVRLAPGQSVPTCMFCGADAADLAPAEPPEGIEEPEGALPFVVDEAKAKESFVAFAKSSWWYPNDLAGARVEIRALRVPAWAWSGTIETHWTGLVSASTRSGKRPEAGAETVTLPQVLVPSSSAIRRGELASIGAFDESTLQGLEGLPALATEVSELTRSVARKQAHAAMCARHEAKLRAEHGLVKIKASSLVTELEGRPVLLPVWIGAYRYGKRSFRILVHGQTGKLVGSAPTSPWKVLLVVLVSLAVLGAIGLAFLACMGGGGIAAALVR